MNNNEKPKEGWTIQQWEDFKEQMCYEKEAWNGSPLGLYLIHHQWLQSRIEE